MVNAKNSYGGYTGSLPFIAELQVSGGKITRATLMAVGATNDTFVVDKTCRDFGLDPYAAR